jgi:hypothetical protein
MPPFAQDGFASFGRVIGCDHVPASRRGLSRPLAGKEMCGPGAKSTPRAFEIDGILLHFLARI